ncbi:ThiF family adenylyltransferase [Candidatus Woesearchaeota archaeon]|nr:ThiF family adenylyltransferase [Candidatus Woesearchaeota archaeon]
MSLLKDRIRQAYGIENLQELENNAVVVVGSGPLAQYILTGVGGIGVKDIYIIDNARIKESDRNEFAYSALSKNKFRHNRKVYYIAEGLTDRVNDTRLSNELRIIPCFAKFTPGFLENIIARHEKWPRVIVDATNDSESKMSVFEYAKKKNIAMVSASSGEHKAVVSTFVPDNYKVAFFENKESTPIKNSVSPYNKPRGRINIESIIHSDFDEAVQGNYSSCIAGGIAAEEVRKLIVKLRLADEPIERNRRITYNTYSKTRQRLIDDLTVGKLNNYEFFKVLLIGAGAISNSLAINLALMEVGQIDVVDGDRIEDHNLPRQILFHRDDVGKNKAEVLSYRMKQVNQYIDSTAFPNYLKSVDDVKSGQEKAICHKLERLFSKRMKGKEYRIVFGCLDNPVARKLVQDYCTKYKMPFIDGGVTPISGQVATYIPGLTPEITSQVDLNGDNLWIKRNRSNSCIWNDNPSVITSNMIIAGLMAGESVHVFYPQLNKNPITGSITYLYNRDSRLAHKAFV